MSKKLIKKVERFEEAVRAHAWIGAAEPGDHEAIELEYKLRKEQLLSAIYAAFSRGATE